MIVPFLVMAGLSVVALLYLFSGKSPDPFNFKKYPEYPLLNRSYLLLLTLLLSSLLVSAIMALSFHLPGDTTAGYTLKTLNVWKLTKLADSWKPMLLALKELNADSQNQISLYDRLFFVSKVKFQYPLSSLLFLDYLQQLSSANGHSISFAMNILCWFSLIGMGFMICYLFFDSANLYDKDQGGIVLNSRKQFRIPFFVMSLMSVYLFYPLTRSFNLGQIQTLISCMTAAALIAWSKDRKELAGFLVGLCCSIKPQYAVLLFWAAFRKEWKFSISLLITVSVLQVVSVLEYGFHNVIGYIDVLKFISRSGESFFANQSVNGLMNRLLFNGNNLVWIENGFPPYHPAVYYSSVITTVVILGAALFWRMRQKTQLLDMALIFLSVTIASPIAWEHHYGILLPIFAILFPAAIARRPFGKWTEAYLLTAYFLVSQKLESFTDQFANTHLNFLQSYLFFGAVMVLVLLYRLLSVETRIARTSA